MKTILTGIFISFLILTRVYPQNNFIYCRNDKFYKADSNFYFLGFSAYYLQWMASDSSKKYIVDDVFRTAQNNEIKVIRTWGFNAASDSTKNSVIRFSPYGLNEEGLRALDYVIYKTKQYDIYLIITLENNFNDFGGIGQYLYWANRILKPHTGKSYNHNDFFTDDSLKIWYKFYLETILNRVNTYSGIKYKNEPQIFSFELMNEASNTGFSVNMIKEWYKEMAAYFKTIDRNHIITTGEIGYDSHKEYYSDEDLFYNSSYFLFDGYKGTSFVEDSKISGIDYSSFHLYPDAWGLEPLAGNTWINDHTNISTNSFKPSLLGEFGIRNDKAKNYKIYFETIRNTPSRSAIIWDYVHPDLMNIADAYAFNEIQNPDLFDLIKQHIQLLEADTLVLKNKDFSLSQNYPNPFNPSTTISFFLKKKEYIKIELFNSIGQLISIISKGIKEKGTHTLYLSFDNNLMSSGVYFYRLSSGNFTDTKKMILLK